MRSDVVAFLRKAKISIPAAPMNRDLRQATGYFENLNLSRAAPINRDLRQAAGNSNLNDVPIFPEGSDSIPVTGLARLQDHTQFNSLYRQ